MHDMIHPAIHPIAMWGFVSPPRPPRHVTSIPGPGPAPSYVSLRSPLLVVLDRQRRAALAAFKEPAHRRDGQTAREGSPAADRGAQQSFSLVVVGRRRTAASSCSAESKTAAEKSDPIRSSVAALMNAEAIAVRARSEVRRSLHFIDA